MLYAKRSSTRIPGHCYGQTMLGNPDIPELFCPGKMVINGSLPMVLNGWFSINGYQWLWMVIPELNVNRCKWVIFHCHSDVPRDFLHPRLLHWQCYGSPAHIHPSLWAPARKWPSSWNCPGATRFGIQHAGTWRLGMGSPKRWRKKNEQF